MSAAEDAGAEDHVQHPVKTVFDGLMSAHERREPFGFQLRRRDEMPRLGVDEDGAERSCAGVPSLNGLNLRRNIRFISPNCAMAKTVFAPEITAAKQRRRSRPEDSGPCRFDGDRPSP